MCGIAGLLNLSARWDRQQMREIAASMAGTMRYRGPDDWGVWVDPHNRCALSHRRLSIIDTSSAGHQPMLSVDGNAAIVFNGELYNFLDLKSDLERQGIQFQSRSDTEVLMEAIRRYGDDAFSRFDAMYAIALYQVPEQELILARDPFGKKPLYYAQSGDFFAFASELHALFRVPGLDQTIDEEAIAEFLTFQFVRAPRTILRSVRKLPPGHLLRLGLDGRVRIGRHFEFKPDANECVVRPLTVLADELEAILLRATRRRMISDVPLGAFLSGGVDSSAVVALMQKATGAEVKTFSLGFDGTDESEHVYAREIARHLGTEHHEKIVHPDVLTMASDVGSVLDEPNGDTSCLPTYLLSQFAREQVTVALSGDGGDEMFGGYGRYLTTLDEQERAESLDADGSPRAARWNPGDAYFSSRLLIFPEPELTELIGTRAGAETRTLIEKMKADLNRPDRSLLAKMRQADVNCYLPGAVLAKVDRMSMQHSLEVRSPLLSVEVARFAATLSLGECYTHGQGKLVLKEFASRYMPREWTNRPKRGFGLPQSVWGKKDLMTAARRVLLEEGSLVQQFIPRDNLEKCLNHQDEAFSVYQVWTLLILGIWMEAHLRDRVPANLVAN